MSIKYNKLSGKHVRFIGNSTGFGFGVAEAVLAAGANVTISSSSSSKLFTAVASLQATTQSSQSSQRIQSFTADLSGPDAEENLDAVFEQAGPIDHIDTGL
ncbi:short chain dehydrogenase reductase family [Colletotrichum kahawae]|uniref:Short chain dehydrogenase reductase family n=1 Tax=Colletotrichum kahawae TaxID=34407 RepID=A0AAE0CXX1_COLKA|nr:short chain dehydrogenase reductase family [Colletotrichum kahawae]